MAPFLLWASTFCRAIRQESRHNSAILTDGSGREGLFSFGFLGLLLQLFGYTVQSMFYLFTSVSNCMQVLRAIQSCSVTDLNILREAFRALGTRRGQPEFCPKLGTSTITRAGEENVVFSTFAEGPNQMLELNDPVDVFKIESFIAWDASEDFHPADWVQFPQIQMKDKVWLLDQYLIAVRLGSEYAQIRFFESPQFMSEYPPMSRAFALNTELRRRLFRAIMQADLNAKVLFRWCVEGIDEGYQFVTADDNQRHRYHNFPFDFEIDDCTISALDRFAQEFEGWTSLSLLTTEPSVFEIQRSWISSELISVRYGGYSEDLKIGRFTEAQLKRCLKKLKASPDLSSKLRKELDDFLRSVKSADS